MVAQWLGTYLPTKEEGGESLVWKDSTCRGATNPMRQNYWAHALEPRGHN